MSDKMRDDAISEAARNHAGDEYFNADRAYLLVSPYSGRIFDAGFDRGWQAAQAARTVPALHAEQIRVAAVAAIREVTGCPDIKGKDGAYLVDALIVNLLSAAPEGKK